MRFQRTAYTDHEVMRAKAMRNNGATFEQIDRELGRPVGSTRQKLTYERTSSERNFAAGSIRCPDTVLAEREARRAALDQRSLSAELLGDPPPGYSMLDRSRR